MSCTRMEISGYELDLGEQPDLIDITVCNRCRSIGGTESGQSDWTGQPVVRRTHVCDDNDDDRMEITSSIVITGSCCSCGEAGGCTNCRNKKHSELMYDLLPENDSLRSRRISNGNNFERINNRLDVVAGSYRNDDDDDDDDNDAQIKNGDETTITARTGNDAGCDGDVICDGDAICDGNGVCDSCGARGVFLLEKKQCYSNNYNRFDAGFEIERRSDAATVDEAGLVTSSLSSYSGGDESLTYPGTSSSTCTDSGSEAAEQDTGHQIRLRPDRSADCSDRASCSSSNSTGIPRHEGSRCSIASSSSISDSDHEHNQLDHLDSSNNCINHKAQLLQPATPILQPATEHVHSNTVHDASSPAAAAASSSSPHHAVDADSTTSEPENENLITPCNRAKLGNRTKDDLSVLVENFVKQTQAVSEELVCLLQERHDLRQQVDMRHIAIEQLLRLQTFSSVSSFHLTSNEPAGNPSSVFSIPSGITDTSEPEILDLTSDTKDRFFQKLRTVRTIE